MAIKRLKRNFGNNLRYENLKILSGTVLIGLGVVVKDKLCSGLNVTGKIVNTVKSG